MKSSREIILNILYKTEYNKAYPNIELKNNIPQEMSGADRAFVTRMVYGVISRRMTLDYVIDQYSKIKLKKLSKYILIILRMGIYQILFMDTVPDNAAVNESVKLAKRYGHSASAGYVNGLLRNVIRGEILYPKDSIMKLAVMYSFPEWICRKWVSEFGLEFTQDLLISLNSEPKLMIRPNILKIDISALQEMLSKKGVKSIIEGNALNCTGINVGIDELYNEGLYTVQDTAAMAAVEALDPQSGEIIIDMCAAPGGKTTYMAELMNNKGRILAFDIYAHKVKLIQENANRLGINIIEAQIGDALKFNTEVGQIADKILCDVPCSGWGIVRRKPDIKWNRSQDDDFPAVQKIILNNASKYLKAGGYLIYSTCTVQREENEGVINDFLNKHKEFAKIYEKTFYPNIDQTDGFYICKLRKNG